MNSSSGGFPPQDLECPDPAGCSVARDELALLAASDGTDTSRRLAVVGFPGPEGLGRSWFRVYDACDGYGQPNPGYGDTRFAPFDALDTGMRVPTLYLAETLEAALLETVLHDAFTTELRVVAEKTLHGRLHARVDPPRGLKLVDLRDQALSDLGLDRSTIASSPSEHYPCTRYVARAIHAGTFTLDGGPVQPDGIVWHSRQAELTGRAAQEVAVVFADRVPSERGDWSLTPLRTSSGSLFEGTGQIAFDQLAENLGITVSRAGDLD